jgi:uncharacterized protein (DUF1778 family)
VPPAPRAAAKPRRRTERLEARVTSDDKELFATAAAATGRSLSDFVVQSLRDAAEAAIREHQTMRLTPEAARQFVELLLNPPEPNAALLRAARRYQTWTQTPGTSD